MNTPASQRRWRVTQMDPTQGAAEHGSMRPRGAHLPPDLQAAVTPCHPRCTHTSSAQNIRHWGHGCCAGIQAGACKFLTPASFLVSATTSPPDTQETHSRHHTHTRYTCDYSQPHTRKTHTNAHTFSSFSKQREIRLYKFISEPTDPVN